MLVLSRMLDQNIVIGDDITVTVVKIESHKVRLGISAPIETSVHRQEIYDSLAREAARRGTGDGKRLTHTRHGLISRLSTIAGEFRLRGDYGTYNELTDCIDRLKGEREARQ